MGQLWFFASPLSQKTDLSASAISASVRAKRDTLPSPVELTATGPDQVLIGPQ